MLLYFMTSLLKAYLGEIVEDGTAEKKILRHHSGTVGTR